MGLSYLGIVDGWISLYIIRESSLRRKREDHEPDEWAITVVLSLTIQMSNLYYCNLNQKLYQLARVFPLFKRG